MGKIDLEKLISSLIENKSSALNDIYIIDIFNALSDQGLEYRDGAIVEIESQELKKVEQEEIPELKESDDESEEDKDKKIQETICNCIKWFCSNHKLFKDIGQDKCLAWFEKHCNPQIRTGLEWVNTIDDACDKRYSEEYAHGEYCHEQSFKWGFEEGVDWLEKQGGHAKFINGIQVGDKVTRNEDGVLVNLSQLNRVAKKQGEQKLADKASLDFKKGDILYEQKTMSILLVYERNGSWLMTFCDYWMLKEKFHVEFPYENYGFVREMSLVPATKEQRDLLFQKIKENGYEWDAEKKKLKKIEEEVNDEDYGIDGLYHAQRILEKTLGEVDGYQSDDGILEHKCAISAVKELSKQKQELLTKEKALKNSPFVEQKPAVWSDEDEEMLKSIKYHLDCDNADIRCYGWIEELKDRVQPQPKQEWSEEDEKIVNLILCICSDFERSFECSPSSTKVIKEDINKIDNWLKSLRPQNWKPSKEQMNTLEYYMHTLVCNEYKEILFGLYADLKKLMEE